MVSAIGGTIWSTTVQNCLQDLQSSSFCRFIVLLSLILHLIEASCGNIVETNNQNKLYYQKLQR